MCTVPFSRSSCSVASRTLTPFCAPSQWDDLPHPSTIEGVAEATPFLLGAIRAGLKITIHGDYDCDGALSSAILEATLVRLGAAVDVYLPTSGRGVRPQ